MNAMLGQMPPYRRIAEKIRQAILRGDYVAGDLLPSVREMAVTEGVNPNTIQSAYRLLENDGWIDRQQGAGTFVRDVNPMPASRRRAEVKEKIRDARAAARQLGVNEEEWKELEAACRTAIQLDKGGKRS